MKLTVWQNPALLYCKFHLSKMSMAATHIFLFPFSRSITWIDPQWLWSLRTSPGLSIFTWERRMPPTKSLQPRAHQGWVWSLPWQTLLFYRPQTHSASCPSAAWVSSLHRFCEQPSTFQIVLFCLNWWELVSAPCRQRPLTDIPMLTSEDTEARNDSINWQMLHNWLVEQQRKDA